MLKCILIISYSLFIVSLFSTLFAYIYKFTKITSYIHHNSILYFTSYNSYNTYNSTFRIYIKIWSRHSWDWICCVKHLGVIFARWFCPIYHPCEVRLRIGLRNWMTIKIWSRKWMVSTRIGRDCIEAMKMNMKETSMLSPKTKNHHHDSFWD